MLALLSGLLLCLYLTWSVYTLISKDNNYKGSLIERALVLRPLVSTEYVTCLGIGNIMINAPVNDDFCDCLDGTDEPFTSACSWITVGYAVYDCSNNEKQYIYSSRCDDGVNDCLDTVLDEVYKPKNEQRNKKIIKLNNLRTKSPTQ